jgi:hypothetical protein
MHRINNGIPYKVKVLEASKFGPAGTMGLEKRGLFFFGTKSVVLEAASLMSCTITSRKA